jgi:cell division control protein 11
MNREDLASQSILLKEQALQREEDKLKELEHKLQVEINMKRQELVTREKQLREAEGWMYSEHSPLESIGQTTYV